MQWHLAQMKSQHCKRLRALRCPALEALAPRAGSAHSALAPNSFRNSNCKYALILFRTQNLTSDTWLESLDFLSFQTWQGIAYFSSSISAYE
jgi:hypothetical protein